MIIFIKSYLLFYLSTSGATQQQSPPVIDIPYDNTDELKILIQIAQLCQNHKSELLQNQFFCELVYNLTELKLFGTIEKSIEYLEKKKKEVNENMAVNPTTITNLPYSLTDEIKIKMITLCKEFLLNNDLNKNFFIKYIFNDEIIKDIIKKFPSKKKNAESIAEEIKSKENELKKLKQEKKESLKTQSSLSNTDSTNQFRRTPTTIYLNKERKSKSLAEKKLNTLVNKDEEVKQLKEELRHMKKKLYMQKYNLKNKNKNKNNA